VSIGTFAVASLMVGQSVQKFVGDDKILLQSANLQENFNMTMNNASLLNEIRGARRIEITLTLTFLVGIIQILMGALRLGFISAYLSDQLVAGFTTGSAVHVFSSQIYAMLGVKQPQYGGPFALYYIYRDLLKELFAGNVCLCSPP
jgi:MFS superfamily sulfate permease-like transporter